MIEEPNHPQLRQWRVWAVPPAGHPEDELEKGWVGLGSLLGTGRTCRGGSEMPRQKASVYRYRPLCKGAHSAQEGRSLVWIPASRPRLPVQILGWI